MNEVSNQVTHSLPRLLKEIDPTTSKVQVRSRVATTPIIRNFKISKYMK